MNKTIMTIVAVLTLLVTSLAATPGASAQRNTDTVNPRVCKTYSYSGSIGSGGGSHKYSVRMCAKDGKFTEAYTRYNYYSKRFGEVLSNSSSEHQIGSLGRSTLWTQGKVKMDLGIPKNSVINGTLLTYRHRYELSCQITDRKRNTFYCWPYSSRWQTS